VSVPSHPAPLIPPVRPARALPRVAMALALLAATAVESSAQVVRGAVRDAATGRPIEGALISLVPESGRAAVGGFSEADGGYQVRLASFGSYRIKVQRIGYRMHVSDPISVNAQAMMVDAVAMVPLPQVVATVAVAADQKCTTAAEAGKHVAGLWEDIRTALGATIATAAERRMLVKYVNTERTLDRRLKELTSQRWEHTVRGVMAFASLPADQLAREGYVFANGKDLEYRGLDANVILAESFLDSHCLKPAPRHASNDSLVGLAFEPLRKDGRVDVQGVLWLNRWTRELDAVEFGYKGLRLQVPTDRVGGRVEFDQLPTGRWIVRRWWLRMPRIEAQQVDWLLPSNYPMSLAGFTEVGGEVLDVTSPPVVPINPESSYQGRPSDGSPRLIRRAASTTRTKSAR
jgi:hypothetical protein